jgi:hypothetical protein
MGATGIVARGDRRGASIGTPGWDMVGTLLGASIGIWWGGSVGMLERAVVGTEGGSSGGSSGGSQVGCHVPCCSGHKTGIHSPTALLLIKVSLIRLPGALLCPTGVIGSATK